MMSNLVLASQFYYRWGEPALYQFIGMSGGEERFGQPGEAQFYDDLSLFIRLFKKIVTEVEHLAALVQGEQDCGQHLRELRGLLGEQEDLVEQYSYSLSPQSSHRNTYFRFVCRLLETLSPLRNRTQGKEEVDLFVEFANKVEMGIGGLKGEANIGKMFRKIFALTLKLCLSCELLLTSGSSQQAVDMLQRRSQEEKTQAEPRNLVMARTTYNSQSIFQKAMTDMNCRFSSLSCLDIDYNFFKADYFLARSQKEELNLSFLDRNAMVVRTIAQYSRRFQEYLKRREKAHLRRTRFREREGREASNQRIMNQTVYGSPPKIMKRTVDVSEISFRKRELTTTAKISELPSLRGETITYETPKEEESSEMTGTTEAEAKIIEANKRKTSYQMKSIYLTLSKINTTFIPLIQQQTNQFLFQQVSSKDKSRKYPALKPNDSVIKGKALSPDKMPTPMLEIRRCEIRNIALPFDHQIRLRQTTPALSINEPLNKIVSLPKKNLPERRNLRIMQIVNKSHMVEFDKEMCKPCEKMDFLSSYNPEEGNTLD